MAVSNAIFSHSLIVITVIRSVPSWVSTGSERNVNFSWSRRRCCCSGCFGRRNLSLGPHCSPSAFLGRCMAVGTWGVAAPSLQSYWVPLEVFHKAWLVYVPSVPYNLGFTYIKGYVCVCVYVHCVFILQVHIYIYMQTTFMHANRF